MGKKRILITYFSESDSTRLAAEKIGEQLGINKKLDVLIENVENSNPTNEFDFIIIGTPNWYGKPATTIQRFLKTNQAVLTKIPVALFYTCMSVSEISGRDNDRISIFKDPVFRTQAKSIKEMTMWEKTHAVSYYLDNLKKIAPDFMPTALGFFKGNLDVSKLSFTHRIVMKLITIMSKEVNEGYYLNNNALSEWAAFLSRLLTK